jgi:Uma2 family endonuclease
MPTTALVTSEQYLALPDEFDQNGNRIKDELIGGEIVKMPPASQVHDLIKNQIHLILVEYLRANPSLGLRSLVEIGARISKHDTFVPDVSIVKRERRDPQARIFQGAPDLAIEVVSPADRAPRLQAKVEAYLANGSHSVWVVYPASRSVLIHTSQSVREFKADQSIEDSFLPGFSAPVSTFFELD